jgi:25S rRNA (uracil2843-N3)-methyltransferase
MVHKMGPKRNPPGKQPTSNPKGKKSDPKRKTAPSAPRRLLAEQQQNAAAASKTGNPQHAEIDLSEAIASIPVSLQQLLLNVFRTVLLPDTRESDDDQKEDDLHTQIQTLKAHLYNRDFVSAFADASPELLRAYALRWSASRCLAYVGIFKGIVPAVLDSLGRNPDQDESNSENKDENGMHVLCIGGGAGAEIVALAGVWRALLDEYSGASSKNAKQTDQTEESMDSGLAKLSLTAKDALLPKLSITAVDVAAWSNVVDSLSKGLRSTSVPGPKACTSPLLEDSSPVDISFQHLDVLSLSEPDFSSLLSPHDAPKTNLVSLMFTLNELFSTSMPKTTQLLLRITDETDPGTILLIVDSPGSYSTLSLGGSTEPAKQRQYPMKFLLEHTLLTVAQGKWEKMLSQDSRWFRREASKLAYSVNLEGGDGLVKLEDMRYQIHVYRRLSAEVK